jgi:hypothetical protein
MEKIILKKAFVDQQKAIVKTKHDNLYGLFNIKNNYEIIPPKYWHIFDFQGNTSVAITEIRCSHVWSYVGINKQGNEFALSPEKITEYQGYLVKSDPCNCNDVCVFCGGTGQIENTFGLVYNFRFWKSFENFVRNDI